MNAIGLHENLWGVNIVDPSSPQVIRATSGAISATSGASTREAEQDSAASNKDPTARPEHALTSRSEIGTFGDGPGSGGTASHLIVGSIGELVSLADPESRYSGGDLRELQPQNVSYPSASTIYCAADSAWHELSPTYLVHFATFTQAKARFRAYHLHQPC